VRFHDQEKMNRYNRRTVISQNSDIKREDNQVYVPAIYSLTDTGAYNEFQE
jgi:hypothetical protein